MGCDWIEAGDTCIGYSLRYAEVFKGTKHDMKELHDNEGDCWKADDDQDDNQDEDGPSVAVKKAWDLFIEQKHPDLKSFGIKPLIGCISMLGTYVAIRDTNYCKVVFGYKLRSMEDVKSSNPAIVKFQSSAFEFPINMPEIVMNFVADYRTSCDVESSKGAVNGVVKMLPKLIKFVR